MREAPLFRIISASLIAGIVLTLFLKVVEWLTAESVYTLLLNVDYIPVLKRYTFSEWIEVTFHLIVSVIVGFCFYVFFQKMQIHVAKKQITYTICCSVLIGLCLFPTTEFSLRTPKVTDVDALLYWLIGHALFGYVFGSLFVNTKPRHSS